MTHGAEKSDPLIVAMKPVNKPGPTGAESVEPRGGAKGITDECCTTRTQSRTRVLQGLGRVRERAKANRKERFTALLHHVDVDLLRRAYFWLKRRAAPGVDGLTWVRMQGVAERWLPRASVLHPWPERRFAATHPRWEPGARIAPAGI